VYFKLAFTYSSSEFVSLHQVSLHIAFYKIRQCFLLTEDSVKFKEDSLVEVVPLHKKFNITCWNIL